MVSRGAVRRIAAVIMVILILLLSAFAGLDHHSCADTRCLICALLGPRQARTILALCLSAVVMAALVCLGLRADGAHQLQFSPTLVEEKVKITR